MRSVWQGISAIPGRDMNKRPPEYKKGVSHIHAKRSVLLRSSGGAYNYKFHAPCQPMKSLLSYSAYSYSPHLGYILRLLLAGSIGTHSATMKANLEHYGQD